MTTCNSPDNPTTDPPPKLEQIFCGFVIDEQGRECAIIETMIRDACLALEQAAITGLHAHLTR